MSYLKLLEKNGFSFDNFDKDKFPIITMDEVLEGMDFDKKFHVDFDDLQSDLAPMECRLELGIMYYNCNFSVNEAFPTPLVCTLHGIVIYEPQGNYSDTSSPPDYKFISYESFKNIGLVGCMNRQGPGILVDTGFDQLMLTSDVINEDVMVSENEILFLYRILDLFLKKAYKANESSVEIDNTHSIFI